ncbi:MAG: AraC family transcriptional regulator [Azospirillaceae bacterium]|nr:AraC family transcriptional regulator [Azospirillaceae bacterium]
MTAPALTFDTPFAQNAGGLTALARLLEEAVQAVEHDMGQARQKICQVRDLLLRRGSADTRGPEADQRSGLAPWQAKRVLALIDSRLDGTLCNDDLAHAARLSTGHFCVAFRRSFGQSPRAFVTLRRIERAKTRMLDSDDTLADIALDAGFADQAHLSRVFRQVTGETPAAWRRANVVDVLPLSL